MKYFALSILNEILWIFLAFVLVWAVILPLYQVIDITFLQVNVLLILLFVILFRYILFLEKISYLSALWVRLILVLALSFIFYRIFSEMQFFFELMDTHDVSRFLRTDNTIRMAPETIQKHFSYYKKEFVFFSTGSLILTVILGLRIVGSLWLKLKSKEPTE
jgi:hypothetical protein